MNIQPYPASANPLDIEIGPAQPAPPPDSAILSPNTAGAVITDGGSMAVLIEMGRADGQRLQSVRQTQQVTPPVRTAAAPATALTRLRHLSRQVEREPRPRPITAFFVGGAIGAASGIAGLATTSLLNNVGVVAVGTAAFFVVSTAFVVTGGLAATLASARMPHPPLSQLNQWRHALDLPTAQEHEFSGDEAREAVSLLSQLVRSDQADSTLPDRLRDALLSADREGGLITALLTITPGRQPGPRRANRDRTTHPAAIKQPA